MAPRCTDYRISAATAREMKGVVLLPADMRLIFLRRYAEQHGADALAQLFAQFIGMANSVVENNREMIELLGITHGGDHPYTAEKYNLPTIFGALCGVELAEGVNPRGACAGCAFRIGTCANQSPVTTIDADWCGRDGGHDFLCHERLNDKGTPTTRCVGFARKQKGVAA